MAENKDEIVRKYLEFRGSVQGVGFRYRAIHAAGMMGVSGWVRNNPDDSVSMEIQGTEDQIDKVVEMINQGRFVEIEDILEKKLPTVTEERGFRCIDY